MGFNMHNRDPEVEDLIDSLETLDKDVYRFMRDQFDQITNEGADYNVDVHDKLVAEMAENKFAISSSKALEIYGNVGWKISQFQTERYNKSKK
jgi:hypothetical protein